MTPRLDGFDHIHVHVRDRTEAEQWYAQVMGLVRVPELAFWAADGGPLTITDADGAVRLALFEGPDQPCRSTIAFGVDADNFLAWRTHLQAALRDPVRLEDHEISWSLYFADPWGNPFEITSYDYNGLARHLRAGD